MSLYKRGEWWWIDVAPPNGGRRIRRPTGEREKALAQRIHDEFKAELWKRRRDSPYLHSTLDAWAKDKGKPDQYRVAKLKTLLSDRPLAGLDLAEIRAKLPSRTAGTFNRYVNVLHAAGIKGLEKRKDPKAKGTFRWLTAKEWKALRAELPEHQRPMADFALSTGLRQANVFRLEWAWVDLRHRVIWIPAEVMKADKPHRVKLAPDAYRILKAQQGKHDRWVFVSSKKADQPPSEIKTAWKEALTRAKIPACRWHDLRHTWATWHLLNGTPLAVLKELGGWSDMRMVMRYAHMAESHADQYAANARPYQPKNVTQPRHKAA